MKTKIFFVFIFCLTSYVLKAQKDSIEDITKLLNLSLEELMNIKVVTATGYLQTTAEAPSTITVITAQQIAERGYEQLEDALRDIPGIDMIHINGYAPALIYFRGMCGAENLRPKAGKGTLTISEETGFADMGSAINFVVINDKLKFEANVKSITDEGLKASSQLLKLAIIVD